MPGFLANGTKEEKKPLLKNGVQKEDDIDQDDVLPSRMLNDIPEGKRFHVWYSRARTSRLICDHSAMDQSAEG